MLSAARATVRREPELSPGRVVCPCQTLKHEAPRGFRVRAVSRCALQRVTGWQLFFRMESPGGDPAGSSGRRPTKGVARRRGQITEPEQALSLLCGFATKACTHADNTRRTAQVGNSLILPYRFCGVWSEDEIRSAEGPRCEEARLSVEHRLGPPDTRFAVPG